MYVVLSFLQQLTELIHHIRFMLHKGMGVAVERDGRVLVAKDLRERFNVHAAFEGAGSKRMPQGMKSLMRYFQFFEE